MNENENENEHEREQPTEQGSASSEAPTAQQSSSGEAPTAQQGERSQSDQERGSRGLPWQRRDRGQQEESGASSRVSVVDEQPPRPAPPSTGEGGVLGR